MGCSCPPPPGGSSADGKPREPAEGGSGRCRRPLRCHHRQRVPGYRGDRGVETWIEPVVFSAISSSISIKSLSRASLARRRLASGNIYRKGGIALPLGRRESFHGQGYQRDAPLTDPAHNLRDLLQKDNDRFHPAAYFAGQVGAFGIALDTGRPRSY